jgi:hypothetical protein
MSADRFATVKAVLAALNARDVDAYIACCTEDVEFVPATVAVSGAYTGAAGIRRFFEDLEDAAPDIQVHASDLKLAGETVVSSERASVSGRASGVAGDLDFTALYEFAGDRICRISVFLEREKALEAAGLSE